MKHFAFLCVIGTFLMISTSSAQAGDQWKRIHSESAIYSVKTPQDYSMTSNFVQLSDKTAAYSEYLKAEIDQRPIRNAQNTYILTMDHSIGPAFRKDQITTLLKNATKRFIQHYEKKNAIVIVNRPVQKSHLESREIQLVYDDEEKGAVGVHTYISFGRNFKTQQIVAGSDRIIGSKLSNDFFYSMNIKRGLSPQDVPIREAWVKHISPMRLFSAYIPPVAKPYVSDAPQITSDKNTEQLSITIYDPVRMENIQYTIYGYKMDDVLTYKSAEKILLNKHMARDLSSPEGISLNRLSNKQYTAVQTAYTLPQKNKSSTRKVANLVIHFAQNYAIVTEVITTPALAKAEFTRNLINHTRFHPEEAHKLFLKTQETME